MTEVVLGEKVIFNKAMHVWVNTPSTIPLDSKLFKDKILTLKIKPINEKFNVVQVCFESEGVIQTYNTAPRPRVLKGKSLKKKTAELPKETEQQLEL